MKLLEFGIEPVPYIREALSQGRTLASLLLELPLETGVVRAFLPDDVDEQAARQFTTGGILKPGHSLSGPNGWVGHRINRDMIDAELAVFVGDYVRQSGRALFEHALANADDPWLVTTSARFCTYGSDVYFVAKPPVEKAAIEFAMKAARSYLFTGVLARGEFEIQTGHEVSLATLHRFAESADHLLIGAFDGEAELIWSRR